MMKTMWASGHHDAAFTSIGNVKMNVAPCGSFFSAHNRPPCDSTIERQIASPMPMPFSFVVKNGSNILSGNSTPRPRSLISVWTTSPVRRTRIPRTLSPATESIASMPLRMRLIRTCWIWTRSSATSGRSLSTSTSMRTRRRAASSAMRSRASATTLASAVWLLVPRIA